LNIRQIKLKVDQSKLQNNLDKSIVLDFDFFSKGTGIIYGTLLLILIILITVLCKKFIRKKIKSRKTDFGNLASPFILGYAGCIYSSFFLNLFETATNYKLPLRSDLWPAIIFQIGLTFFFCRLSNFIFNETNFIKLFLKEKNKADSLELKELLNRIVYFLIITSSFISIFITFGIKTSSLASLFGGLAIGFSLALQKFLQNIIGGILLIATRPFKVFDTIETPSVIGTVENIGIFYTKIRDLENVPVFIPNSEISNMNISQLTYRKERRIKADVTLRYEDLDKVGKIIKKIRKDLNSHSGIDQKQNIYVKFHKWDASSINILVQCYTNTNDYGEFLDIQEDVFIKISDSVKDEGGDFAFNSTTIYLPPEKREVINNIFKND
tara:strand:+ start:491 stop:1636 length:1146 start_codon:yes stop_codon:yes gene_type:complete